MQLLQRVNKFFAQPSKSILLLFFWNFTIKFVYDLVFKTAVDLLLDVNLAIAVEVFVAIIFLCLAPVASFVADIKFGRFKTLVSSTCVIILSNSILIVGVCGFFAVHEFNYLYYILLTLIFAGSLASLCGVVFFLCNVIQFGTEQLRDAPTRYSVLFLYAIYWCDNIVHLLTTCFSLPGKNIHIYQPLNIIYVDKLKTSLLVTACGCFIALSVLVVFIVHSKKHWLLTEHLGGNPYLLTWRVVKFAAQHNKPIRRSAFTYCESDCPSRIDFGKQRYGGPFTTEQVEDVKTFLNILKVLLCLGPVFFLEQCTIHRHNGNLQNFSVNIWEEQLFNGVFSTALAVIFIPLLIKCFTSRFSPNMFKRMAFSIACLLLMYLVYILYSIISTEDFISSGKYLLYCTSKYNVSSEHFISPSAISILLLENIFEFMYRLLLYISVWEFICCQSPQHMKGLLFGLLYAIRAFNQLLATVIVWTFGKYLKEDIENCNRQFYYLNIGIAVLLLLIFTVVSYKYRYRKRDDICNIYQYAENYYSNYGTLN